VIAKLRVKGNESMATTVVDENKGYNKSTII
jgi:hypothetical protein